MSKVTQKGQVTIPKHIRSILEVGPSDEVEFEYNGDQVIIKKKKSNIENLKKYIGYLTSSESKDVDEIIDEMRGNGQR